MRGVCKGRKGEGDVKIDRKRKKRERETNSSLHKKPTVNED